MSEAHAADAAPPAGGLRIVSITPAPTEAERAAIVAAVEALRAEVWPQMNGGDRAGPLAPLALRRPPLQRRQNYGGWT